MSPSKAVRGLAIASCPSRRPMVLADSDRRVESTEQLVLDIKDTLALGVPSCYMEALWAPAALGHRLTANVEASVGYHFPVPKSISARSLRL